MYSNCLVVSFFLCLSMSFAQMLYGKPLSPTEATSALLRLVPNEKGFLTKLKTLVKAGADINAQDRLKMTIMHRIAFHGGSAAAAKFLLSNTDDDAFKYVSRHTPFFLAIYSDNVPVAKVFAEEIADINAIDGYGSTPLLYALEYDSNKVAKMLIDNGASLDVKSRKGMSSLHLVTDGGLAQRILEQNGNLLHARNKLGQTPLHFAVSHDDFAVVKIFLEEGSDPNAKDDSRGDTPLHYAKSAKLAELLIKKGGDPNARNFKGITPMHVSRNGGIVKVFAKNGGDLNAMDDEGNTPLDFARVDPINLKRVEALLLLGAYPNNRSPDGEEANNQRKEAEGQTQIEQQERNKTQNTEQPDYLKNLNELAREQDSNPIIGRVQEMQQLTYALKRKGMKGTVLVGEAGVGKTALVKGLAYLLAHDKLPELAGREVFSLDVGSMWGHEDSKWVGQLHKRVNDALKFIAAAPEKRILFIDEVHQLLGGRSVSASSSPPITDILKPYLGSGDIQLIGATTHDEYQSIIEGDRAIVDRLLRIDIEEPSAEETLAILQGIKSDYEQHYGITISTSVLRAAVALSNRYMASQQQPRKAITLLDEAAVYVKQGAKRLTKMHIATAVAKKISIDVATILKSKNEKAATLLPALQEQIYGQERVLVEIDSTMAIAYADLVAETRPRAVFLFAGSTGVGKTAATKAMARHMFDSEDNFIVADMSNYKHPINSVGALTELLTRAVKAKPHAVILLDEIEKSHPEVRHMLLQLFDEGRLTDSRQRQVDFTNTIIVMTTNSKKVDRHFLPELQNRLDKIITFGKLSKDVSLRLVQKQLAELNRALQDKKITVTLSDEALQLIAKAGYSQEFGAREMARVFARLVKFPLADGINKGFITSGKDYSISLKLDGRTGGVKASITTGGETVHEVSTSAKKLAKESQQGGGRRGYL